MPMTYTQANDAIRAQMKELILLSNNIGTGNSREFDAVINAAAILQDYLEKNG